MFETRIRLWWETQLYIGNVIVPDDIKDRNEYNHYLFYPLPLIFSSVILLDKPQTLRYTSWSHLDMHMLTFNK